MMENDKITITLEEYKELLIIKGRYEQLKEKYCSYPTTYSAEWISSGTNVRKEVEPPVQHNNSYGVTLAESIKDMEEMHKYLNSIKE